MNRWFVVAVIQTLYVALAFPFVCAQASVDISVDPKDAAQAFGADMPEFIITLNGSRPSDDVKSDIEQQLNFEVLSGGPDQLFARPNFLSCFDRTDLKSILESSFNGIEKVEFANDPDGLGFPNNLQARILHGVEDLRTHIQGYELFGQEMAFTLFDAWQPDVTHPALVGRIQMMDAFTPSDPVQHSTHVAATLVGDGNSLNDHIAEGEGFAPQATLKSYCAVSTGLADDPCTVNYLDNLKEDVQSGSLGSNNSWGWGDPTPREEEELQIHGQYTDRNKVIDDLIYEAQDYSLVASVGNTRRYLIEEHNLPFGQVKAISVSKNVLSVGSITRNGLEEIVIDSQEIAYETFSFFSNAGPTDDGRIKPDLTAIGAPLTSAQPCNAEQQNCYCNNLGTSMSAPVVSGSIILLQQLSQYVNDRILHSDEMKAVLINSVKNNAGGRPTWWSGWGILDVFEAGLAINEEEFKGVRRLNFPSEIKTIRIPAKIVTDNLEEVKLTLVWNDKGFDGTTSDGFQSILNADLDLRLELSAVDAPVEPWTLDSGNTGACSINEPFDCAIRDNDDRNNVVKLTLFGQQTQGNDVVIEISTSENATLLAPEWFAIAFSGLDIEFDLIEMVR